MCLRRELPSTHYGIPYSTASLADDAVGAVPRNGVHVGRDHAPDPEGRHDDEADEHEAQQPTDEVADQNADPLPGPSSHHGADAWKEEGDDQPERRRPRRDLHGLRVGLLPLLRR